MFILTIPLILLSAFLSNNYITVSRQILTTHKLKNTQSLSIVHISDLHNKNFGHRQSYLIKKIRSLKPDMIAITGDLVDHAAYQNAVAFIQKASKICPIYYVRGNHESLAGNFPELEKELLKYHVNILKNKTFTMTKNGITYLLTGLDDPLFQGYTKNYTPFMNKIIAKILEPDKANTSEQCCHILLSHRPELFHLYSSYPFDLVLCGHAHGGQFRPPFTDGLYAPNQGVFPKYTSGAHTENGTTEIISRGLGNSGFPLRLLNCPEIVHIIIKPEKT